MSSGCAGAVVVVDVVSTSPATRASGGSVVGATEALVETIGVTLGPVETLVGVSMPVD